MERHDQKPSLQELQAAIGTTNMKVVIRLLMEVKGISEQEALTEYVSVLAEDFPHLADPEHLAQLLAKQN